MELDRETIRSLCTERSFGRGVDYFEAGRVKVVDASPSWVKAVVSGTDDYRVEINLDNLISATCTCPYDWGGYCKHIVATMLTMVHDDGKVEALIEEKETTRERVEILLKKVELEDLRSFLLREFKNFPNLMSHFLITFSDVGEGKSINDYKEEVRDLYSDAGEGYGFIDYDTMIDFSSIEELADLYIAKGAYLEGARICRALFETISEMMANTDDSYGYYGESFCGYLEKFAECIDGAGLDFEAKRGYIDYIFNKYIRGDPDYFQDEYYEVLQRLCTSEAELRYWKELLEPHLPEPLPESLPEPLPGPIPDPREQRSRHYRSRKHLSAQIHILLALEERDEYYKLIEYHYMDSPDLCLLHAEQLKKDGRIDEAVRVAEKGIEIFQRPSTLIRFLNEIYKTSDIEKYRENLQTLFVQGRDWASYEKLKEISSEKEWDNFLERVVGLLSQEWFGRDMIISIYLKEEIFDEALEMVLDADSLDVLSTYHEVLSRLYPAEYFDAYRRLIMPFIGSRTGRAHYRQGITHLKNMKGVGGFEDEFGAFLDELRETYSRRPAFIDEARGL